MKYKKNHIAIPSVLKKMSEIFSASGYNAYLVGGAVRDIFMGHEPHDYDIATNATPQQVMKIFRRTVPTGIAHGTVTVLLWDYKIEVTTFRTESDYSDGRHPDSINYAATIEEDLSRRDFTMNAIAVDLKDGSVVDPFNGQTAIAKKIIETVGSAKERFSEDGLRPVRAIRFAAQLGFTLEEKTYRELFEKETLDSTAKISVERFRDEFLKMLATEKPSTALRLLEETGIMKIFLPEMLDGRNCTQQDVRGFHQFDVMDHCYYACDGAAVTENLFVRLAALFHDIGKPASRTTEIIDGNEIIHFHGHENIGEKITQKVLTNLKFPNATVNAVSHLVKEHMFYYEPNWSDAAVRRFIVRVGENALEDLYAVRLADISGMHNVPPVPASPSVQSLLELKKRVESELKSQTALSLKDLAVNGRDLMTLGIPGGKQMGFILDKLFEAVLEDPKQNTKDTLLKIAQNLANVM